MMVKLTRVIFSVLVLAFMGESMMFATKVEKFYVRDYGAVGDGKTNDTPAIRKAIYAAIKSGKPAQVHLDGFKVYRLDERDDRWEALDIINASNLSIEGNGATLLVSPNARAFIFDGTKNCSVRNLDVDYDPLPFTQGDVVNIDKEKGAFDVELHDGFPDPPSQEWMKKNYIDVGWSHWRFGTVFFPKDSGKWFGVKGYGHIMIDSVDRIPGPKRVYRITITEAYRNYTDAQLLAKGDQFVFRVRYTPWERNKKLKGLPIASFRLLNSSDLTLENIRHFCSPNSTIELTDNVGQIVIRNFNIFVKPGTRRLISNLSDGIHCKNNRVGPIIEDCHFEGLLDDGINISTMAEVVQEVISPNVLKVFSTTIAWYKPPIDVGDEMQILDPVVGKELCRARVTKVDYGDGPFRTLTFDKPIPDVKTARDVNDRKATQMFNLDRSGKGYIIRNNKFQYMTRNAALVKPAGLIENNIMLDMGGHGVLLGNDLQFSEGPVSEDIIVRNNRIVNCSRNAGIAVSCFYYGEPEGHIVKNILIENNTIEGHAFGEGIVLLNVKDISLKGNTLRTTKIDNPKGNRKLAPVRIENCKNITIDGGSISDERNDIPAAIHLMGKTQKTDVTVTNMKYDLSDNVAEIK